MTHCLACGAATRLKYRARRTSGALPPDELRCTSTHLAEYGDIFACRACGLAYQQAPAEPHELTRGYADVVDTLYLAEEERRRAEFRELLSRLEAFGKPGRLLEIGSFAGLCLDEARARGWDPVGLEPSRWAAGHARSLGHDVVTGTIDDAPWEPGSFDAVCMWDVLEHLPDPLDALRRMRELAAPDGAVALTTVNVAGLSARVLGPRWPWYMRMHLWYFTPQSLRLLFARAGFERVHVERHPKRFRVGYLLKRTERYLGGTARAVQRAASRTGLADRVVTVDVGDIVLAIGVTGT